MANKNQTDIIDEIVRSAGCVGCKSIYLSAAKNFKKSLKEEIDRIVIGGPYVFVITEEKRGYHIGKYEKRGF